MEVHLEIGDEEENSIQEVGRLEIGAEEENSIQEVGRLEIGAEEENSIQEVGRLEMKVAMTPILRLAASGSEASLASVLGAFQPSSYLYPGMSGTRSSRTEA